MFTLIFRSFIARCILFWKAIRFFTKSYYIQLASSQKSSLKQNILGHMDYFVKFRKRNTNIITSFCLHIMNTHTHPNMYALWWYSTYLLTLHNAFEVDLELQCWQRYIISLLPVIFSLKSSHMTICEHNNNLLHVILRVNIWFLLFWDVWLLVVPACFDDSVVAAEAPSLSDTSVCAPLNHRMFGLSVVR